MSNAWFALYTDIKNRCFPYYVINKRGMIYSVNMLTLYICSFHFKYVVLLHSRQSHVVACFLHLYDLAIMYVCKV